jgi:hypothetical protein
MPFISIMVVVIAVAIWLLLVAYTYCTPRLTVRLFCDADRYNSNM